MDASANTNARTSCAPDAGTRAAALPKPSETEANADARTDTAPARSPLPLLLEVRYLVEYGLLRMVVGLVRLLPLDRAVRISAAIWKRLAPFGRRHRRALANLARAYPEKTPAERQSIAVAMWENLGRVMAETMLIDRILAEPSRIEVVPDQVYARYRNKFGSVVGVSLHMGNWELAVWPLTLAGTNPAAVYRFVKNPYVDRYLRYQRRKLYPGGMLGKGSLMGSNAAAQKTARLMINYVRNGGRLGLVGDLYDRFGIPVPFFGHLAPSTPAPALVARHVGARIWLSRCIRVGTGSHFKVEIKELKVPRSNNTADDIKAITAAMQQQFEAWIREYPEQWMWSNRKWS